MKPLFTANGEHHRKPQLVITQRSIIDRGCLASTDTSTTQPLHLRFKEHHGSWKPENQKDGCEIMSPRDDRKVVPMKPQHYGSLNTP